MDHRVPRAGVLIFLGLALAAVITFVVLNNRFEGPGDPLQLVDGSPRLTATFANTKRLPTKQPVLFKGLVVGRVDKVEWQPDKRVSVVTFSMHDDFELHEDAVLRIGERSLLGDPVLDVVTRGSDSRPVLRDGDRVVNTKVSVNFDEALDFLDKDGRADVRRVLDTIATGVGPRGNSERLNGSVAGLARTLTASERLTTTLRGQEESLARLISSAATVLDELGRREAAIRTIVGSGRTTLDALASQSSGLERGLTELPLVLASGRRALTRAQPLVTELRPPIRKLRALAPTVEQALDTDADPSLRDVLAGLSATLDGLKPLRRAAVPVLDRDVSPLLLKLKPLVRAIAPASQSLVPALRYLSEGEPGTSRAEAIAGLYASLGAANKGSSGPRGRYSRAGFSLDPLEEADQTVDNCPSRGFCNNAYPRSGDALDPQAFTGSYPRIVECVVPPRTKPTADCK